METVRDLVATHGAAPYPSELVGSAEVGGVALILLDADITGFATTFLENGGALRPDQWRMLRDCAADARTVVPQLTGEAWVYFGRLYALSQALLRAEPVAPAG